MRPDARLEALFELIPPGRRVADIGTDHAYLPLLLVERRKSPFVVATDLRPGPLAAARRHIEARGLADAIELRQGDGLEPLAPGEVDLVVIAGLGAERIVAILDAAGEKARSYPEWAFMPHTPAEPLRRYAYANGLEIISERVVPSGGRFYELVAVRRGDGAAPYVGLSVPTEAAFWLGPLNMRRPSAAFCAYWQGMLGHWERLLNALGAVGGASAEATLKALSARRAMIERALEGLRQA